MITAILIDDEPKSIKNLELLLSEHCNEIQVINKACDALTATKHILEDRPDVVFLDIQMPGYDGFDVLDQVKNTSSIVVFITAHKEYAINALRNEVFDYLLKPVDIKELRACVNRVKEHINKRALAKKEGIGFPGIIELTVKDATIFIKPQDIIRLEADGNYTTFYLEHATKHLVSKSIKAYESFLDPKIFYRCHASHIVNLKKVSKYIHKEGLFAELLDGSHVEIARAKKNEFLEKFKKLNY